jgi:hypothetical protein
MTNAIAYNKNLQTTTVNYFIALGPEDYHEPRMGVRPRFLLVVGRANKTPFGVRQLHWLERCLPLPGMETPEK